MPSVHARDLTAEQIPDRRGRSFWRPVIDAKRLCEASIKGRRLLAPVVEQGTYWAFAQRLSGWEGKFLAAELRNEIWQANLQDGHTSIDVDAIAATVDSVLDAIWIAGPAAIRLDEVDFSTANAEHLVAILRCTYSWRANISGWKEALENAPKLLQAVGFDPVEVLTGLDV